MPFKHTNNRRSSLIGKKKDSNTLNTSFRSVPEVYQSAREGKNGIKSRTEGTQTSTVLCPDYKEDTALIFLFPGRWTDMKSAAEWST